MGSTASRQLFEVPRSEVPEWGADLVPHEGDPAPVLGTLADADRAQVDRGTTEALLPRLKA
jgi:hypothetical protein